MKRFSPAKLIDMIRENVGGNTVICKNLGALMEIQRNIIEKHIDAHKWFNKIPNKEQAITDFVNKFAWLIRELYCGYACGKRLRCESAKDYIPKNQKDIMNLLGDRFK